MEPLKILTISRTHFKPDLGIFGVMDFDGIPFAVTLENYKSRIPKGEYTCKRSFYYNGGYDTFEIIVPNRTRILFHKGNWQEDSEGCVLIGENFYLLNNKTGIGDSKHGFEEYMGKLIGIDEHKLVVREWYQPC